jgi:hypothetical protein
MGAQKLAAGEYKHAEDFISDVRLVFRNAFVYNKQVHTAAITPRQ